MHTIEDTISIQATPEAIVTALTTHRGVAGWWTEDCDVSATEETVRFPHDHAVKEMTFHFDRADARAVEMSCTANRNNPVFAGTKVAFYLEPDGATTHVRLVHSNHREVCEDFDGCVRGWAYFIASLKQYVETGTGTPYARRTA